MGNLAEDIKKHLKSYDDIGINLGFLVTTMVCIIFCAAIIAGGCFGLSKLAEKAVTPSLDSADAAYKVTCYSNDGKVTIVYDGVKGVKFSGNHLTLKFGNETIQWKGNCLIEEKKIKCETE
jgi:uncharacterized protein YdgA (DUF945 family)